MAYDPASQACVALNACPAGSYPQQDTTGKTICTKCPPGATACTNQNSATTCDAALVKQTFGTGANMTTLCLRNCSQGFYPDANSVCVSCPIGCLNCNSTMCMNPAPGYAIDLTATPVALIQMTSTYNMTGKLMNPDKTITACDVSCKTCIGDKMRCTSCPPTKYIILSSASCVSTCPQGTWINAGNATSPAACIPCQNN